jgi:hypothetical protein
MWLDKEQRHTIESRKKEETDKAISDLFDTPDEPEEDSDGPKVEEIFDEEEVDLPDIRTT